jgi:8-hydroxy-5-deazaflavin:NADPH oxidoreductase
VKIGIIGAGNMGGGLGRHWAGKGHEIMFAAGNPADAEAAAKAAGSTAQSGTTAEAAAFGDAVLLAVPWTSVEEAVKDAGSLDGKVLINCSMPLAPDYMSLLVGHTSSGAEEVQKLAGGARVVLAFNTAPAQVIATSPFEGDGVSVFYCGDDAEAKGVARGLIEDAGFNPVDAGALQNARLLEPMTELLIQLAFVQGMGANVAYQLLHRPAE